MRRLRALWKNPDTLFFAVVALFLVTALSRDHRPLLVDALASGEPSQVPVYVVERHPGVGVAQPLQSEARLDFAGARKGIAERMIATYRRLAKNCPRVARRITFVGVVAGGEWPPEADGYTQFKADGTCEIWFRKATVNSLRDPERLVTHEFGHAFALVHLGKSGNSEKFAEAFEEDRTRDRLRRQYEAR